MQNSPSSVSNEKDLTGLPAIETLTPRELEVMIQVFNGKTTAEIGHRMELSPRTVEVYRCNTLRKLNVSNSFLAMRQFLQAGFLSQILEGA